LRQFELEIQKVHQSHEELMRSSEKKEKLERAIRYKLEIDSRRLQEQNRYLKGIFELFNLFLCNCNCTHIKLVII